MQMLKRNIKRTSAQSILELSLLGAAILSILGLLLRYTTSLGQAQNTQLQAMRAALQLSASEAMRTSSKTGNYKNAAVLWIEDVPTVEGGEKYGSASLTPTVSFGSGTMTNLLQMPLKHGDRSQLPRMIVNVNGQQFNFTTSGFGYKAGYVVEQTKADGTKQWIPNPWWCQTPNNPRRCLAKVPNPRGGYWTFAQPRPVFWTKLPRTDKKFCYGPGIPANSYCNGATTEEINERFRLDPVHGQSVMDMGQRQLLQWQWYPVLASDIAIDFFDHDEDKETFPSIDIDADGHEESILQYAEVAYLDVCSQYNCLQYDEYGECIQYGNNCIGTWSSKQCQVVFATLWADQGNVDACACPASYSNFKAATGPDFQPNQSWCHDMHNDKAGSVNFMVHHVFTLDSDQGDINLEYNNVDKLSGYAKPGFVDGRAKLTTYSKGELGLTQAKAGSSTQTTSKQTKDTINVIEREIQLDQTQKSNCTGDCYFLQRNPNVTSCSGLNCCDSNALKFKNCLNTTTRVLHVRSLMGARVGRKFKTLKPIPNWP